MNGSDLHGSNGTTETIEEADGNLDEVGNSRDSLVLTKVKGLHAL